MKRHVLLMAHHDADDACPDDSRDAPSTAAGRALLRLLAKQIANDTDSQAWRNGVQYAMECAEMSLSRIEAEAAAAERARLAEAVRGLLTPPVPGTEMFTQREFMNWARAAVLALLEPGGDTDA